VTETASAAFFSYSREDSDFAHRLAGDLKAAGASVWLDQMDIIPGQRWDRAIEDALKNCSRLIAILSPSSVESTNFMDEVSFALEKHKTVIPVLYKDCEIPFRLRRVQHVDFRQDYDRGIKELLRTLNPERAAQTQADAKALALATDQIKSTEEDPPGSEQELADAIKAASSGTRGRIFKLVEQTYEERKSENPSGGDQTWVQGIISILNALIATDVGELKQEYHSLFSQVLRRTGDLQSAIREVSKAIEIRNKLKKMGWKWYEFNRARCLIENDSNFFSNKPSDQATVSQIKSDLHRAFGDKKWGRWYGDHAQVREWMRLNLRIEDDKHEP